MPARPEQKDKNPRGRYPSAEGPGVIYLDTAELYANNRAVLVPNPKSYDDMEKHFNPSEFQDIFVVWVKFNTKTGPQRRQMIKDGHTREAFAYNHREEGLLDDPNFFKTIASIDVTANVLGLTRPTPEIVLSVNQYFDSVIGHTTVHREIASRRIAAHFLTGWEGLVGPETAAKFPALAALSLLYDRRVPLANSVQLATFLDKQRRLYAGETIRERRQVQQALLEVAPILRQTLTSRDEIARSAFELVTVADPVIGGATEAQKQIYGLVNLPEVQDKLEQTFPGDVRLVERSVQRQKLARIALQAFVKLAGSGKRESKAAVITDVLKDLNVDYSKTIDVLSATDPLDRYDEIRKETNLQKLRDEYLRRTRTSSPTPEAAKLIELLGKKLYPVDMVASLNAINAALGSLKESQSLRDRLQKKQHSLISKGVNPDTIKDALSSLARLEEQIYSEGSQIVQRRTQELRERIHAIDSTIKQQIHIRRTRDIVSEVYRGTQFGTQVVEAVVSHIRLEIDLEDEGAIRRRLDQLRQLDPELQSDVIAGRKTIRYAQQMQEEKRKDIESKPVPPLLKTPVSVTFQPPRVEITGQEDIASVRRATAEKHLTEGNERLSSATVSYMDELREIDLEAYQIAYENKTRLRELMKLVWRRITGLRDVDAVALIEEGQRAREAKLSALRDKILKDQDEAEEGTRTGR